MFRDRPLAEVLQEVGRYRRPPPILEDASLGSRRLSGMPYLQNPEGFLAALPHILPVAVRRQTDGAVIVTRL